MKIYTVFTQKGGAGKTTIAMNLATGFHKQGKRVLVVDADVQKSSQKWESRHIDGYTPFPVRVEAVNGLSKLQFATWLQKRVTDVDYVIIDTPPLLSSPELANALYVCDTAILPIQPHVASIDSLEDVYPLVAEIERLRGSPLDVRILFAHYAGRREIEKHIMDNFKNYCAWPTFNERMRDLAPFADAFTYHTSLYNLPGTSAARKIIDNIVEELS